MLHFTYRNLTLFFRDKTAVFLSFLAEFIILLLYFLFMRDNLIANFHHLKHSELLVDVWMISGLLGITSVSTTLGAYGIILDDQIKKIRCDFFISPLRPSAMFSGYMFSAMIIGFLTTFVFFILSEIYIVYRYGVYPGADHIFILYGLFLFTTAANASISFLLVSFLKSNHALACCCTILGSLIGFLTGIYLPMGAMPESVRFLIIGFPVSHSVALFRQILMQPFLKDTFSGLPPDTCNSFLRYMGIQYEVNHAFLSKSFHLATLLLTVLVCSTLALCRYSRSCLRNST